MKHHVFSFPKTGRTWTTLLWYFYAAAITDRRDEAMAAIRTLWDLMRPTKTDFFRGTVEPALSRLGRPVLRFGHVIRIGADAAATAERIASVGDRPHALLVRDPVKTLESFYHHLRAQPREFPAARSWTGVGDIVRSADYGIDRYLDYYRLMEAHAPVRSLVVHYEDLRADTAGALRALLLGAGDPVVDENAVAYACQMTAFDRLRQMEIDAGRLEGRSVAADAMRFRSGRDESGAMSDSDRAFIRAKVASADVPVLRRYVT